jgi:hypothetical protein
MTKIKIELTPYRMLFLKNKKACKIFIKIIFPNTFLSIGCLYIDEYINQYVILDNGTNKEVIKWEIFKRDLLYFLQRCNEKFFLTSREEANYILIHPTSNNSGNLYFQTYRDQIMLIHNNTYLNFGLTSENLDEIYKIISYIENPENFLFV